ncbi:hypothetical protein Ancab_015796 [Ancistrocladus abbreviatus]
MLHVELKAAAIDKPRGVITGLALPLPKGRKSVAVVHCDRCGSFDVNKIHLAPWTDNVEEAGNCRLVIGATWVRPTLAGAFKSLFTPDWVMSGVLSCQHVDFVFLVSILLDL